MQDAYTLNKPLRRRLPRNSYNVNNILDVWETDLVDVQDLESIMITIIICYSDRCVFEIFTHVPLK